MRRELHSSGQKTHAKATGVVKPQFQVGAELKNQMVMRRILGHWRSHPQTTRHAEVDHQDPVRLQTQQEVLGAAVDRANRATDNVRL